MRLIDDRILDYIDHYGAGIPELMARDMPASRRRVQARCEILTEGGMIAPEVPRGRVYVLTNWGLAYLDRRIDANHQPHPRRRTLLRG